MRVPIVYLVPLMVIMLGLLGSTVLADDSSPQHCLMQPDHLEMCFPDRGFHWLSGEVFSGRCDDVPTGRWNRRSSGSLNLFVCAEGPSGSGRYWNVTVGVAESQNLTPVRGVCLVTTTLGWRTLQEYKKTPLPWLDDLDEDGKSELIIWSSFPLREDASLAEYGLVAWVYRLNSERRLTIDWDLSRHMAREIARAYRSLSKSTKMSPRQLRGAAAEALEMFADKQCQELQEDPPAGSSGGKSRCTVPSER